MPATQLLLFDLDQELPLSRGQFIASVNWSHSRRSGMSRCALAYYRDYYGSNSRVAVNEPLKEKLRFLKQHVSNRYLLAGDILHIVIKTYFLKARTGDRYAPERLANWARQLFRENWDFSKAYQSGQPFPDVTHPPTLLREYLYEDEAADELCRQAEERLVSAIMNFATNETFAYFRERGMSSDALVEHSMSLSGLPCKVSGKIDLAFQDGSAVNVVDWKLGQANYDGDNSLQLAVYGLWAIQHFGCQPEQLRVFTAHLSSSEINPFRADKEALQAAKLLILQDAERMAYMDQYGRDGVAEAFTPCWQPLVCHTCIYEGLCYD